MREMKDSGIEWIGAIPKDWDVVKFKYLHNGLNTGEAIDKEYWESDAGPNAFYTAGLMPIRTGYSNFPTWKETGENDLLLARNGTPYVYLPVSKAYYTDHIIRAAMSRHVNRRFIRYCLQQSITSIMVDSVSIPTWSAALWNNQILTWPSAIEQERIAAFLDAECAEIDAVLEKTRASIDEYKKLKQAVITQAVTKGIRGDRPMKDSGIEWIGEIPAGIPISRVGLHFDIVLGKMLCSSPVDDNYTLESYYCAADVHFEGLSNGEKKKMWFSPDEKEQYCVKNGDLLVVEGGAGAGGCAIAVSTDVPIYIQNSIMIVRSKGISNIRYLRYLLECLVKKGYIDVVCNKATIPHFTKDKLANVPFIVFSQSEQEEIAEYLNEKCTGIDALIAKKQQYLTEIGNYKKSLIYEYVTGKKEVKTSVLAD